MRSFYTVSLVVLLSSFSSLYAQFTEVSSLTGGSIVTDIVSFHGDLYAAVDMAGVYKSSDSGQSWTKTNISKLFAIRHFVIHNDELLALSYSKVLRTSDGISWAEEDSVNDFITDAASNGETIFIVAQGGVYYSTSGSPWSKFAIPDLDMTIGKIAVDGEKIVVTTGQPGGTVFYSNNGGANWTSFMKETDFIFDVAFHNNAIYILAYDGLYRSIDNGSSWSFTHASFGGLVFSTPENIYLFTDRRLYRSPDNGIKWFSTSQISDNAISALYVTDEHAFVGTWGAGIFRSDVELSGILEAVNDGIAAVTVNEMAVANGKLFVGTDFSFVRTSDDNGNTWKQEQNEFGLTQGNSRQLLAVGSDVFSLADAVVSRSSNAGTSWISLDLGLNGDLAKGAAVLGNWVIIAGEESIYISNDRGNSWKRKQAGLPSGIRKVFADDVYLYLGTWNGLFRSDNLGDSWERISEGLPDESVNAFVAIDNILFVGTQYNGLYISSNGGNTWELSNSHPAVSLAVKNNFVFYGARNGAMFYSKDFGQTWVEIGNGLPSDAIVNTINFTDTYVFAGGGNAGGLWKLDRTTFMPPGVNCYSDISSESFKVGAPIYVKTDQPLYSPEGVKIESSNIDQYVTVSSPSGAVSYSIEIDSDEKLITVLIYDPIPGETYTITVAEVENEYGLASSSVSRTFSVIEDPVTALDENPNAEKLTLYPNPITGKFYVSIPTMKDTGSSLMILDLSGRKVREITLDDQSSPTEVDMSSLPNGMYMVIVSNESSRYLQKIVKR